MSVGGFSQALGANRQEPAQSGQGEAVHLASADACGSLPVTVCHGVPFHLFRTPPLHGQTRAFAPALSVFSHAFPGHASRQVFAEITAPRLSVIAWPTALADSLGHENHKTGRAACVNSSFWPCPARFWRWQGVSKMTGSGPSLAPRSALARPARRTTTFSPALRSARRAVRCATTSGFADLNAPRAATPAGQLSEAIGARRRPGGLCFVSGRPLGCRPRTGRDWNVQ